MAPRQTRAIAGIAAVVVLALVVGAAGFGGGRYWRRHNVARPRPTPVTTAPPAAALRAVDATSVPKALSTPGPGILPVAAKVAAAISPALRNAQLGPGVHALVVDAGTGTTLYQRSASTPAPPASTNKLLTATAALSTLGPARTFSTTVVAGARAGQVILVGGGDPTLSAAPAGAPPIYSHAARLADLAARTKRITHGRITSIVVDASRFTGPQEAPGWAPEDVPSTYASAIAGLVVDGGRPARGGPERTDQPAAEAGRAFATLLGHPGLPVTAGRAPAAAKVLARVQSAPVVDLVEQMLFYSDNTIAEMLARQVALARHQPASFAGAVAGVRMALAALGIAVPATLYDDSGLSVRDRLPATLLVRVLRTALTGAHPGLSQLISALPVAGWDGTLADRYRSRGSRVAAGRVRAKTGTLTSVVVLAGVVRNPTGRVLVFAIMLDRASAAGPLPAEEAVDDAVAKLAACTCR